MTELHRKLPYIFGEMRQVLEAHIETGFRHSFLARFYQAVRCLQTTPDNPFLRCQIAHFGKSRLKVARLRPV